MKKLDNVMKIPVLATLLIAGGAVGAYASMAAADTTSTSSTATPSAQTRPMAGPHVMGTITAINGSTITITAQGKQTGTYTIDASNASVMKDGASSSVSALAVGDKVFAAGTINGTSVTATQVFDGKFGPGKRMMMGPRPGVMGQVTAVNGSTLTVSGKDGKTYTVDAAGATVQKMVTEPVADIKVGDTIGAMGAVSGTTITAKQIMDGVPTTSPQQ